MTDSLAKKDAADRATDAELADAWRWAIRAGWLTSPQIDEAHSAGRAQAARRALREAERELMAEMTDRAA